MREIEKLYLKWKLHEIKKKQNLRQNYKNAQNQLDENIRFFERKYRKKIINWYRNSSHTHQWP